MKKVAVIIVNWNTGKLLTQCLNALLRLPERALITDIYVVDNASSDHSLVEAERSFADIPTIHFEPQPINLGFARANNQALKKVISSSGADLPHMLFLNPDTIMHPGSIAALLQVLEVQAQVGIVGPKLLNTDGTLQPSVRAFPGLASLLILFSKLVRFIPRVGFWRHYLQVDFTYAVPGPVDQVMGAAMLVRRDLLLPGAFGYVGPFDEQFFVWFEEVDLCQRAKQAGWVVYFTPDAVVTHHGGVSFNQLVGIKRALPWLKSGLHYARKYLGTVAATLVLLVGLLGIFLSIPAMLLHTGTKSSTRKQLQ